MQHKSGWKGYQCITLNVSQSKLDHNSNTIIKDLS